ncbi:sugar ABC transporter ATP-binding protein [Bifidobacterium sp. 64T4]|uniref:sugar ABC transporter ATP-binding protein n=1 Tax=Bifidobacterium pongonis TaxID=2834432 RepID=UPI001C5695EB|nr:sugar ABC transporter ATP-binding protein [Bifidobacterium pongonis]MBW3094085.1 sugar ABC transporter ATP-binding protein [Bifidobacterium pongonis]
MTRLSLIKVSKTFGGTKAVDRVSLAVEPGNVHVLLGENGAGKSTLIKMMSGIHQPDEGRIEIDDRTVRIPDTATARRLGIAVIHQELNLVPQLSVMENLFLGALPTKAGIIDRATMERRAQQAIKPIGLDVDVHTPIGELGVAQQQMTEIAKALMQEASILILDEPTAALSRKECDQLFAIMDDLKTQGVGMVYISHHLDEVARIGDKVTVLRDGRRVGTVPATTSEQELVKLMVGRNITNKFPRIARKPGGILLETSGLSRKGAIHGITLQVRAGEVVGLAGLVGAGRTETLRAIFGADTYDSGTVRVHGKTLPKQSIATSIAAGLGLVPENRRAQGLIPEASVADNLGLATMIPTARHGFIDRRGQRARETATARKLRIRMAGITQSVGSLSGGNQQKIVFGKWSMADVDILLLDEPTRGVDVGARVEIYDLINSITANGGCVLMASSDLPEVLGMSDRVLVMSEGRITGGLPAAEATQEKVMALAVSHMGAAEQGNGGQRKPKARQKRQKRPAQQTRQSRQAR